MLYIAQKSSHNNNYLHIKTFIYFRLVFGREVLKGLNNYGAEGGEGGLFFFGTTFNP